MIRNYFIQVNDYMTPVKIMLTDEEENGVKKFLKALIREDKDSLVSMEDEDGNEIIDNYSEWIKTHRD